MFLFCLEVTSFPYHSIWSFWIFLRLDQGVDFLVTFIKSSIFSAFNFIWLLYYFQIFCCLYYLFWFKWFAFSKIVRVTFSMNLLFRLALKDDGFDLLYFFLILNYSLFDLNFVLIFSLPKLMIIFILHNCWFFLRITLI
jgi:hypothetical protein